MAKYVIESPHTKEECLEAMEEAVKTGMIDKCVFGCQFGDHTGWAYVEADSKAKALENVPSFIRGKANAYEVRKYTAEEVKAAHH